ncbi:hypothetical protein [Arthrobacter sp. HY1533]|uniref:hypothetical protein n=1 Tax=Arthrobacter sp. HY1533 TaxID=2970919 RepID=UPI0022B9EF23|nr:hypothetical protein [Arthrobacter sp. HY1533]
MSNFNDATLTIYIWKDLLPEVKLGRKDVPYVEIPDPHNPADTIHFISLPGDGVEELYTLAAAYLALAQHMEKQQAEAAAANMLNPANLAAAVWDIPRYPSHRDTI